MKRVSSQSLGGSACCGVGDISKFHDFHVTNMGIVEKQIRIVVYDVM